MRQFIVVCMLLFLLPFNIWGQRTSKASSSTTDSLFNDAARQYYVKKLHGEDVRGLKASFNGNVTIEFGKRKHQVYNVTVIYSTAVSIGLLREFSISSQLKKVYPVGDGHKQFHYIHEDFFKWFVYICY